MSLVRGYVAVYGIGTASNELLKVGKECADDAGSRFTSTKTTSRMRPAPIAARSATAASSICTISACSASIRHAGPYEHRRRRRGRAVAGNRHLDRLVSDRAQFTIRSPKAIPCRLPELYKEGVNVAVAVDGALDLPVGTAGRRPFMSRAALDSRLTPENVIEMQTICAAKAAGMADELGSLVPGKRADWWSAVASVESYPATNPVHQVALTVGPGSVEDGDRQWRSRPSGRRDDAARSGRRLLRGQRIGAPPLSRLGLSAGIEWPVAN